MSKIATPQTIGRKLVDQFGLVNVERKQLCELLGIPNGSFTHVVGKTFTDFMLELQKADPGPPLPAIKSRIASELMRGHLLNVALDLAKDHGYTSITRRMLATRGGVSHDTTYRMFPYVGDIQTGVMREAVERDCARVVAQGLAFEDPIALEAPPKLKERAVQWLRDR